VNLIPTQSIRGSTDPLDWLKIPFYGSCSTLIVGAILGLFSLVLWYCDQGMCHLGAKFSAEESYLLSIN